MKLRQWPVSRLICDDDNALAGDLDAGQRVFLPSVRPRFGCEPAELRMLAEHFEQTGRCIEDTVRSERPHEADACGSMKEVRGL